MSAEDLGPTSFDAADIAHIATECMQCRGFRTTSSVASDVVVIQADKSGWSEILTGRRLSLVLRLSRQGQRWQGEATITDWRNNLAFFCAGALLGPVGLSAAALSAASRLVSPDERHQIFAHLRTCLAERAC